MPYSRRRGSRRRYSVNRSVSTVKRRAGYTGSYRRFFARSGGSMSTGKFKLKGIIDISSTGTGTINNAVRITQPDNFDGAANALADWTSFANMYDQFRVTYVKIKWIPSTPNDDTTTRKFSPIYVFTDFDSIGLNPTNATCVGYGNLAVKNVYMPWTYRMRIPKLLNTATPNVAIPGWMDTLAPDATGAIYLINSTVSSFTNSQQYGTLICSYWVKGIQRR